MNDDFLRLDGVTPRPLTQEEIEAGYPAAKVILQETVAKFSHVTTYFWGIPDSDANRFRTSIEGGPRHGMTASAPNYAAAEQIHREVCDLLEEFSTTRWRIGYYFGRNRVRLYVMIKSVWFAIRELFIF